MYNSQQSSTKHQPQPWTSARPTPPPRSQLAQQPTTRSEEGSVAPTRHEPEQNPAPSPTTNVVSPTIATLPRPPPTPCTKPPPPYRRRNLTPPTRPSSDHEQTPARPAPDGKVKKVQSAPGVPPPLVPRRLPNSIATADRLVRSLPEPNCFPADMDLLSRSVPPSAKTSSNSRERSYIDNN